MRSSAPGEAVVLQMNLDHIAELICITGRKGTGKTSLLLDLWKKSKARYKFAFDPKREISRKLNLKVCTTVEGMKFALERGYPVLFDSSAMFPGDRKEGLTFFCRWVWNVAQ